MARTLKQQTAIDIQVQKWLEAKGVDPNMVREDYTLACDSGRTWLTITLFAGDFPLEEIEPDPVPVRKDPPSYAADHSDCGPGCTFKNETNKTNRKHITCIDITTARERPYSSWICGPECPTDETPSE